MPSIASNIQTIRAHLTEARKISLLAKREVELVAVSKGQEADAIKAALELGQRRFGENRVQEAMEKWPQLREAFPDATLHLIGPLQSNKAKEAVALFDVIETVDRLKIAEAIAAELTKTGKKISCFIQVNTGEEPQKAGILPQDADAFIEDCRNRLRLPLAGLMCIPPAGENPAPHFGLLRELARRHAVQELSMGMSGDYETAIRFGATQVRIGTALFGERSK